MQYLTRHIPTTLEFGAYTVKALQRFNNYCSVQADHGTAGAYILTFTHGEAETTIRVVFNESSGAELAITHMTTLPDRNRRHGYGTKVLKTILELLVENGMHDIRAVQVQEPSESFWRKNGFTPMNNETNDYLYRLTS